MKRCSLCKGANVHKIELQTSRIDDVKIVPLNSEGKCIGMMDLPNVLIVTYCHDCQKVI